MKTTTIVLTIEHSKDLPSKVPLTDVIAQRVYGFLYSQGCEAGVTASVEDARVKATVVEEA